MPQGYLPPDLDLFGALRAFCDLGRPCRGQCTNSAGYFASVKLTTFQEPFRFARLH